MFSDHILSWMIFFPLIGAALVVVMPRERYNLIKWVSLVATLLPLLQAGWIFQTFDRSTTAMQYVESFSWIPSFNIQYFLGIDGISVSMVLLTAIICTIGVIASWGINKGVKGYFALFLVLDTGMMGVFCALDFFLFYIFWEVMLLPMYFLIGIWGGPRREYAAIKFFLYTLFGSVLILLVMLAFYFFSEGHTFSLIALQDQAIHLGPLAVKGSYFRIACWLALFVGFAIKIPLFPFHTWLPDAHVEAPTAISVILAGVLLKMGAYGILRISYPLLPDCTLIFAQSLAFIGVVNIIYGAFCAMAQKDMKKLIAYSSISHMGFVVLGMASFTPEGINGAVLQMFNHGTITAMLFLIAGIIYDRARHRQIDGFGGLATIMPRYAAFTSFAFFAALGLPGLSGFISEVLVFLGAFQTYRLLTIISAAGVIITAAYFLWTIQRMFLGKVNERYIYLPDLSAREFITLAPLAVIIAILGVYPMPMINLISTSLNRLNEIVLTIGM